ncbi:HAMP domain-containing methyl-accepting chemotaxis protein [Vibrio hannami]|nr:HAMP domain-containing methyl-accepting chemotaxis protein [Vibrio hannami]MDG3086071.1 HAMP domain-containing methyl-accepting chemotaxis protein [Vibrio hannami]
MRSSAHDTEELLDNISEELDQKSLGSIHNLETQLISIVILFAVVLILLVSFIIRSILKPIHSLNLLMDDIANGEGDLTARLDESRKDELSKFASSFNIFVSKIQQILIKVGQETESLSSASSESQNLAELTTREVIDINSESTNIELDMVELSAVVDRVSESSDKAKDSANNATATTDAGNQTINRTIQNIETLVEDINTVSGTVEKLEGQSKEIDSVLNVIEEIAEQTNLLALNAAIEAARAGEQGRGFAVVADEVRSLALRTHDSTQTIQNMLQRLHSTVEEAVEVMAGSQSRSTQSIEQISEVRAVLASITDSIGQITQMSIEIAESVEQEVEIVNDVNAKISNISQKASTTNTHADNTLSTSSNLSNIVASLESQIAQFNV